MIMTDARNQNQNSGISKESYWTLIRQASNALWEIFKKRLDAKDKPDEWWGELLNEINEAEKPYLGTPAENYVKKYAVLIVNELEAISKGER